MFRLHCFLIAAAALAGTAGARIQVGELPTYTLAQAPAELRPAIQRGELVLVALQNALLSELTRELNQGGPAGAMQSCHLDATAIAQRVGREEGLPAGRTSHRLRNPLNAPRAWAAPVVKRYAGRRAADIRGVVVDLGDSIGLMHPIAHRTMCASCHGPADSLSPAVTAVLRDRYPADRATDFAEGEIRGWFWVEVPKRR